MRAKDSELPADSGACQPAGAGKPADSLMQAIRTLGRLPKETRTATQDERHLASGLRYARQNGTMSGEDEAELAALSAKRSDQAADSGASQPARAGKANDSLMQALLASLRHMATSGPTWPDCKLCEAWFRMTMTNRSLACRISRARIRQWCVRLQKSPRHSADSEHQAVDESSSEDSTGDSADAWQSSSSESSHYGRYPC